jgi:hypothetical protein
MAVDVIEDVLFETEVGGPAQEIIPETAAGVYVLMVDVDAMQSGDHLEITIFVTMDEVTGPVQAYITGAHNHDLDGEDGGLPNGPIWISPPIPVSVAWSASILQTAGTARELLYQVLRIG